MAVATTPNARIFRTGVGAPANFSALRRRRIDVDRGQFTVLAYLGNTTTVGGGGFQFTVNASRRLIIFAANAGFADLLGGAGPTIPVGDYWDFAVTTIVDDIPNNVVLFFGLHNGTIDELVVSYSGAYNYQRHGANERPGNDGAGGAFFLHGSLADDRDWHGTTLTPTQMRAEIASNVPIITPSAWWRYDTAATAANDSSGNGLTLTVTPGTGSVTTTDGPTFGGDVHDLVISDSVISLASEVPAVRLAHTLTIDDATHGHQAEVQTAAIELEILPTDTLHAHTADVPALTSGIVLDVASAVHALASEAPAVALDGLPLSVESASHGHTADVVEPTTGPLLDIANAVHGHQAGVMTAVLVDVGLDIESTDHEHRADVLTLSDADASPGIQIAVSALVARWTASELALRHTVEELRTRYDVGDLEAEP